MKEIVCAGIIPFRFSGLMQENELHNASLFLVQLRSGNHFSFPKGHLEEGESPYEAAKRELYEETHLEVKKLLLENPIEEKYYYLEKGVEVAKKVFFFVAEVQGEEIIDTNEILEGKWVDIHDAEKWLTYTASKNTYREALQRLQERHNGRKRHV